MIKPINISPLNTTNQLEYKCEKCGNSEIIEFIGSIVNVDNDGNSIEPLEDYECQKCGGKL
jgi:DNA-directed RNA polymerase subunit RPC12/RpoP